MVSHHSDESGGDPAREWAEMADLVQRHCGAFGTAVCELIMHQAFEENGLERLLRRLRIPPPTTAQARVVALAQWLTEHGSQALIRMMAERAGAVNYAPIPLATKDPRDHDRRVMELLIRRQREKRGRASDSTPGDSRPDARPPGRPATPLPSKPTTPLSSRPVQPPMPIRPAPPQAPASKPSIPIFHPYPKAKQLRGRPENPISGSIRDPRNTTTSPSFNGPPGYPWPWPRNLKPGPEPPPPDIPPSQLTWPYVDRRANDDRRKKKDRRQEVNLVYRNRRYGGDRRRTDRRKNRPPRGKGK